MKLLTFCLLVLIVCTPTAFAYPQDQLQDCIASAKKNPNVKDVSQSSIEKYCDCALNLIVDEAKDVRESGYECAKQNFN